MHLKSGEPPPLFAVVALERPLLKEHYCNLRDIQICEADELGVSCGVANLEGDLGNRTPGGTEGIEALGAWGNVLVASKSSNRRGHRATATKWAAIAATGEAKKFAPRAAGDGVV